MNTKSILAIVIFVLATAALSAQNLEEARHLAETGNHTAAEKIYNAAIAQNPDNIEALIGAGFNYSWDGQTEKAAFKFDQALAIDPENVEALAGKGYNLGWSKQYSAAKSNFLALEKLDHAGQEGRKGLGYINLWQENGAVAIDYFEKLLLDYPYTLEYYIALAQSYLLENQIKKARITLRSALKIDSTSRVANELLQNTYGRSAPLELDLWAGYSKVAQMGTFNIRTVQLSGQVSKKLRMFLKYDNSLSLDISSLVRAEQEAQAFSVGAIIPVSNRLTSKFEYGARILPAGVVQQVFSTEQVWFLSKGLSIKAGGFLGVSDQLDNEWLAYGSIRVPIAKWYAIEPYYFYSRVENAPSPEKRFMLNNQFRLPSGYELNLGALYGKSSINEETGDDNIFGSNATLLLPFSQAVWGQFSLRWEKSPIDELKAAAFGIKIRLEK